MTPSDPLRVPARPRVDPPAAPPSMLTPPRRRRLRTRGGGWLLPGAATPPDAAPREEHAAPEAAAPGEAELRAIEHALDARSPRDRSRWLRLRREARRWMAE